MRRLLFFLITLCALAGTFSLAVHPAQAQQTGAAVTLTQARTARDTAFKVYQDARALFRIVRDQYKKSGNNQSRVALEREAKTMLTALSTAVSRHLDALETQIQRVANITDADRTAAVRELTRAEQSWQQQSEMTNSLKAQAAATAKTWPPVRLTMLRATGLVQSARFQPTIASLHDALAGATTIIGQLRKAGQTTVIQESFFTDFSRSVQTATAHADDAQTIFSSMTDAAQAESAYKSGLTALMTARKNAQSGQTQLKALIKAIQSGH